MPNIDWTKPVQDHTGRIYTILTTERPYEYAPIVAMRDDGLVVLAAMDGTARTVSARQACPESDVGSLVLRNVQPKPVRREGWINVYPHSWSEPSRKIWRTVADADVAAADARIACVKIEWEEPGNE